ncbi:hypothetical protein [Gloeocapsa sp. PCC 73106]|uniref:hypothetical protein n=1 Tax=Gloeocapsa sp. PCC 73106 TaxID=102232 RepID=UPI0002AC86ED|nr:hypothetical protein [Gloeocapsa sp. PCC 73106]ELR96220.1 hypothetical protein GLO73106DRAFT_00000080 [Gloeocapsa sp. PCC 73106]
MSNSKNQNNNPHTINKANTVIIIFTLIGGIYLGLFNKQGEARPWIPSFVLSISAALIVYNWLDKTVQSDNKLSGKIGPFDFQTTAGLATLLIFSLVNNHFLERQMTEIKVEHNTDPDQNEDLGLVIVNTNAEEVKLISKATNGIATTNATIDPRDIDVKTVKEKCLEGEGICAAESFKAKFSVNDQLPKGYIRLCNDKRELDLKRLNLVSFDGGNLVTMTAVASKNCSDNDDIFSVEVSKKDIDNGNINIRDGSVGFIREVTIAIIPENPDTKLIRSFDD